MNIKMKLSELRPNLDAKFPISQVYKSLLPLTRKANLLFIEPQIGHDYLQWALPGTDWVPFKDLNDIDKSDAARCYKQRMDVMRSILQTSPLKNSVLSVPSEEEFVYFKQEGSEWSIALVAWGYHYPQHNSGQELETWIVKEALQTVAIGFTWGEKRIPDFKFILQGHPRTTNANGLFLIDTQLPVGNQYSVQTLQGQSFLLKVTEGQSEYLYDLTQYFQVEIAVSRDDVPQADATCLLCFGAMTTSLKTDADGKIQFSLPFVQDGQGIPEQQQPACVVTCNEERQHLLPSNEERKLLFTFSFATPASPPEPVEEPEPQPTEEPAPKPTEEPEPQPTEEPQPTTGDPAFVTITLYDYEGYPLPDLPFVLTTKKYGEMELKTDEHGNCLVEKEKFTHKEKFKIHFTVSAEYQQTHDIHDKP